MKPNNLSGETGSCPSMQGDTTKLHDIVTKKAVCTDSLVRAIL